MALGLIAMAVIAGFALRLASAQGALWLDEAWSASFARDVRTIAGVFWQINHDNNHHLNTLWLQIVGFDAHPAWQRMLSIVTGTVAAGIAGAIGWRRSAATGAIVAALFALSPVMVSYGSEARGYAPMMLALLVAILMVDRWLDAPDRAPNATGIALAVLFGCLAQLTMIFGVVALLGWAGLREWQRSGFADAVRSVSKALGPAVIAAIGVVAINFAPMLAGRTYEIGHYTPFDFRTLREGLRILTDSLFALPVGLWGLAGLGLLAATLPPVRPHAPLYLLVLVALPVTVALLQLGNSGNPRYFLVIAVVALLLVGEALGLLWSRWRSTRLAALAFLALLLGTSIVADVELIRNQRGDVGRAIDEIARRHPGGSIIRVDSTRASAVLRSAAAYRGYDFEIASQPCPPAPVLFVDRDGAARFPGDVVQCGVRYRPVLDGRSTGLSGNHWRLYERVR